MAPVVASVVFTFTQMSSHDGLFTRPSGQFTLQLANSYFLPPPSGSAKLSCSLSWDIGDSHVPEREIKNIRGTRVTLWPCAVAERRFMKK